MAPLQQWGTELGHLETDLMGHERAMKTTGIQQWKDSMFSGTGTPVHQWSKKCKVALIEQAPTPTGLLSSNPMDILAHTTQVWSKIWQAESFPPTIHQLLPCPSSELPALTVEDIVRAAARFKRGTAVPDGWHPGHFGRLANPADIEKFISVLHLCEQAGRLPPSAKAAMVKMIPKPRGGHRPIALFKAMFRLWGKARNRLLASWATSLCSATFTMSPTRRITDGIFRELVRSLLAQAKQTHIVEMHMDISKFFDHVCRLPLADLAVIAHYPVQLLQLSLDVYGAERRIVLDCGLVSAPVWARDGIMAGSPHAVFETMAYLVAAARTFVQLYPEPRHHLTIFVDDVAVQATGDTEDECISKFVQAASWLISHLQDELRLPIETEKTFLLGTSDSLVHQAAVSAGEFAGTTVTEVRKLGTNYSHQHRRSKPVIKAKLTKARVSKALHRHRRILALAGPRSHGHVFHTGILPEATFGVELTLMHPAQLKSLRIATIRANKLMCMGVPHSAMMLALPIDRDPEWHVNIRTLQGFAREVWNREHGPQPDHLTTKEIGLLFGLPAPPPFTSYATAWKDPVAAIHYALRRLDLTWEHPTVWKHNEQIMDLRAGTPALLSRLLKPAHRLRQLKQAAIPGAPDGWAPGYLFHVLDSSGSKRSLSGHGKKALLSYMLDQFPTRTSLAKWGFAVDPECPHCHKEDTAYHRIFECNMAWDKDLMIRHLRRWRDHPHSCRGILDIPCPAVPEADTTIRYTLFGSDVEKDRFGRFLAADGPVYIDGSAFHVRTPFATSGWAAVQMVNGRVSRSMMAPVGRNYPQTSDFAEHIALYFVSAHSVAEDPIEVVTDCASVISYYHQALLGRATSYQNVLGGVWSEVHLDTIAQMHKIKSHMSKDKAREAGVEHWWEGNFRADLLAQKAAERALLAHAEAEAYNRSVARAEKFLRDIAKALVLWKGVAVSHHDLEKVAATRKPHDPLPPHQYEWDQQAKAWTCARCWKTRKTSMNGQIDTTGCKAISRADARKLHYSHSLRFAQGPWGARPLMYCVKCGHYTTTRLAALSKICRGQYTAAGELTSAYRLFVRTIGRGIHPTKLRHRLGHTYTPSLAGRAASDAKASLRRDIQAAQVTRLVTLAGPPSEAALAEELAELAELEAEAALRDDPLDQWGLDLSEEDGLAHGFLGFDEA
jgi:hypothetical protein